MQQLFGMVVRNMNNLLSKKLQYEAARTVTGLTRSVSIDKLLQEIGWVSLADRRIIQKLVIVYKEKNGNVPNYLHELFPPLVGRQTPYALRNNNNFETVARRTEIFSRSFIPSAAALWNDLDNDIKTSPSLLIFKNKLKHKFQPPKVPTYFLTGERSQSVLHARIRNRCSNLNDDLFRNHLSEHPTCACGYDREDADHFFFNCDKFTPQRIVIF